MHAWKGNPWRSSNLNGEGHNLLAKIIVLDQYGFILVINSIHWRLCRDRGQEYRMAKMRWSMWWKGCTAISQSNDAQKHKIVVVMRDNARKKPTRSSVFERIRNCISTLNKRARAEWVSRISNQLHHDNSTYYSRG